MPKLSVIYHSASSVAADLYKRQRLVVIGTFVLAVVLLWYETRGSPSLAFLRGKQTPVDYRTSFGGTWKYRRDGSNLLLDRKQCQTAFPGLLEEVDRAVASRRQQHISVADLDGIVPKNGYVRAMIYDQEVRFFCVLGDRTARTS